MWCGVVLLSRWVGWCDGGGGGGGMLTNEGWGGGARAYMQTVFTSSLTNVGGPNCWNTILLPDSVQSNMLIGKYIKVWGGSHAVLYG